MAGSRPTLKRSALLLAFSFERRSHNGKARLCDGSPIVTKIFERVFPLVFLDERIKTPFVSRRQIWPRTVVPAQSPHRALPPLQPPPVPDICLPVMIKVS